jgi:hypothetical protein
VKIVSKADVNITISLKNSGPAHCNIKRAHLSSKHLNVHRVTLAKAAGYFHVQCLAESSLEWRQCVLCEVGNYASCVI